MYSLFHGSQSIQVHTELKFIQQIKCISMIFSHLLDFSVLFFFLYNSTIFCFMYFFCFSFFSAVNLDGFKTLQMTWNLVQLRNTDTTTNKSCFQQK